MLQQLFRGFLFIIVSFIGLFIAFALMVAGIFALGIMYIVSLVQGKRFSAAEYWQNSRARASRTQSQFSERFRQPNYSRREAQEITDVEVRELK